MFAIFWLCSSLTFPFPFPPPPSPPLFRSPSLLLPHLSSTSNAISPGRGRILVCCTSCSNSDPTPSPLTVTNSIWKPWSSVRKTCPPIQSYVMENADTLAISLMFQNRRPSTVALCVCVWVWCVSVCVHVCVCVCVCVCVGVVCECVCVCIHLFKNWVSLSIHSTLLLTGSYATALTSYSGPIGSGREMLGETFGGIGR